MAMKIENISEGKIIGIGEVTVLPGESKDIPEVWVCQNHWQAQSC